jgi:hypothetical protein
LSTADALGRSIIVNKDSVFSAIALKDYPGTWFACDDTVRLSFDLIPSEAVKYLKEKAFEIAGTESDAIKQSIKDALIKALEEGRTFDEFKRDVNSIFDSFGVTNASTRHLQTVFRTNIFAAYSIGSYEQVKSMEDRFPLAKYGAVHDSRSRHIPLEGYYKIDKVPIPPIDYNCRCVVRYIHISQITGNEKVFEYVPRPDLIRFDQRGSL